MTTATLDAAPVSTTSPALMRPAPCSTDALGEEIAALAARLHAATYELLVLLREFDDAHRLEQRLRLLRALAALAHGHRPGRCTREGARRPRAGGAAAHQRHDAARRDLLRQGAGADPRRHTRQRGRAAGLRPGRDGRPDGTLGPGLAASRRRGGGGAGRVAAPAPASLHLGRRRRDGRDSRPAHAGGRRRRPARARGRGRSAVPRGSGRAEGRAAGRRSDAGPAAGRRPRAAGRGGADGGPGPRISRRPLPGRAARGGSDRCGGRGRSVRGPWRWTTARWTFPRKRRDAFPATRSVVPMRHGADGAVLDVGRKTRTVPPSIRRALQARDRSCRFPGCTARRCDAHHVEHWIDGGATSLDNLVLLCRRHHRAVHEGGFAVRQLSRRDDDLPAARWIGCSRRPRPCRFLHAARRHLARADDIPVWDGTPFDLVYAIDVLYAPRAPRAAMFGIGRLDEDDTPMEVGASGGQYRRRSSCRARLPNTYQVDCGGHPSRPSSCHRVCLSRRLRPRRARQPSGQYLRIVARRRLSGRIELVECTSANSATEAIRSRSHRRFDSRKATGGNMSGSKRRLLVFVAATAADVAERAGARLRWRPRRKSVRPPHQPEGFGLGSIPGVPRR